MVDRTFNPICKPVFYVDMPLTADGHGPALDADTASVEHQIWDNIMQTVCVCGNEAVARELVRIINVSAA